MSAFIFALLFLVGFPLFIMLIVMIPVGLVGYLVYRYLMPRIVEANVRAAKRGLKK